MEQNTADLIEALTEHSKVESAGEGGNNGKVSCWFTADAIQNRDEVKQNLTLLANAHGYDYGRGSLESNGYTVIFEPSDND